MLRRSFLAGLLMPNLVDAWFADRAPGAGKVVYSTPGDATTATGVGGLSAAGVASLPAAGTTYPALPEPGTVLPPPGSKDRGGFLIGLKAATGFDSNTHLSGIPTTTDSGKWSFSTWLNLSVNTVVGFTPTPLANVQNYITAGSFGVDSSYFNEGRVYLQFGLGNGANGPGPIETGFVSIGNNIFTYPVDVLGGEGWVHLMASIFCNGGFANGVGWASQRTVIYINDTPIVNQVDPVTAGLSQIFKFKFSEASAGVGGVGVGGELYAATTEWWEAPGQFVDWSLKGNRYKFHTSDATWGPSRVTYAPVDIGSTGARPTGAKPRLYLAGGPSLFVLNRAAGGAALTVNGDALVLVDDVPS